MGSTFKSLHYHIIFSTKERRPFIKAQWRPEMHRYLGGIVRRLGGKAEAVGGVEDHVHLMVSLNTDQNPAALVREVKKASSVWASGKYEKLFAWQEGYAVFTVSSTHSTPLRRYIANQEEHHRKATFLEELQRVLIKNHVTYDPKYLL